MDRSEDRMSRCLEGVRSLGFGGCRCDDENRNKEIERVARLKSGQCRCQVNALIVSFDLNMTK